MDNGSQVLPVIFLVFDNCCKEQTGSTGAESPQWASPTMKARNGSPQAMLATVVGAELLFLKQPAVVNLFVSEASFFKASSRTGIRGRVWAVPAIHDEAD